MGFLCAGCCHLGCAWHPPPWHPSVGGPQSVPWLEGSLGLPAGSTSYQQEVCVSIALLRNFPKHLGKRCLGLQNRRSSQVLGNIYVTCLRNKKKRGGKKPQEKKKKGSGNPQLQHNMCSVPNTPVPGWPLTNCGRHHSHLTDLPGEAAMVLILTSTTQICN